MDDIKSFKKYLQKLGLANASIETYSAAVSDYYKNFNSLTESNVLRWRDSLASRYKPKSMAIRVHGMNHYLRFRKKQYEVSGVRLPKVHHLEGVISLSDYNRLVKVISASDKFDDTKWLLIFKLMAMSGARVSEARQLRVEHVNDGKLQVLAKGAIYRTILLPKRLCKEISLYLEATGQSEGFIFGRTPEKPYSIGSIEHKCKVFAKRAKIPEEVMHPHSFRHLFGKRFMEGKGDITVLADLMGHSSIETTRIYTRRTIEEQQSTLDRIVTW